MEAGYLKLFAFSFRTILNWFINNFRTHPKDCIIWKLFRPNVYIKDSGISRRSAIALNHWYLCIFVHKNRLHELHAGRYWEVCSKTVENNTYRISRFPHDFHTIKEQIFFILKQDDVVSFGALSLSKAQNSIIIIKFLFDFCRYRRG